MWLHGAEKHPAVQLEAASYYDVSFSGQLLPTMEGGSCPASFPPTGEISTIKGAVPSAEKEDSASTELLPLSALN
jgi:hypothetical protein